MLTIQIPHIAIQKVSNGYVVQWKKRNPVANSAEKSITVSAIATTGDDLVYRVNIAAIDIEELC
jgi:hypothetical protein